MRRSPARQCTSTRLPSRSGARDRGDRPDVVVDRADAAAVHREAQHLDPELRRRVTLGELRGVASRGGRGDRRSCRSGDRATCLRSGWVGSARCGSSQPSSTSPRFLGNSRSRRLIGADPQAQANTLATTAIAATAATRRTRRAPLGFIAFQRSRSTPESSLPPAEDERFVNRGGSGWSRGARAAARRGRAAGWRPAHSSRRRGSRSRPPS